MWTPAAVTAFVVALGGLITAVTAFWHSINTRKQVNPPASPRPPGM